MMRLKPPRPPALIIFVLMVKPIFSICLYLILSLEQYLGPRYGVDKGYKDEEGENVEKHFENVVAVSG